MEDPRSKIEDVANGVLALGCAALAAFEIDLGIFLANRDTVLEHAVAIAPLSLAAFMTYVATESWKEAVHGPKNQR